MKRCRIIGCQSSGLRNSKSCFEHVKNPPRPSRGFAQASMTVDTGVNATVGNLTFTTGTSGTTTGTDIIWTGNSGTSTWTY